MSFYEEAAAAVDQAYRGLDPKERQVAADTSWQVRPGPTPQDYAAVGARQGQGIMLGLYQQPGGGGAPTVTLFEDNIRTQRVPAWVVVEHELTHVLGYDHALRDQAITQGCGLVQGQPTPGLNDDCPVCQVYAEISHGAALLEDLADAVTQQHRIPIGLGGTIPQARLHLFQAEHMLSQVALILPDRQGEVQDLRRCLQHILMRLVDQVPAQQLDPAAREARRCRKSAHVLAWAFYDRQPRSGMGCAHRAPAVAGQGLV